MRQNKRKRMISLITAACLVSCVLLPGTADASSVGVRINNIPVTFTQNSGAPFIDSNKRTQVPLRAAMEAYGCRVDWEQASRTAFVSKGATVVKVPIGADYIVKNGVKIKNDTTAQIKNSRTYLPIRAVLEAFGGYVSWDSKTNSVSVDNTSPLLQVHFINVGQGDASLIDIGDWEILIDGGDNQYGNTVVEYLKPYIDGNLDLVIGTHPDADHIGGLDAVINTYHVSEIIDSGVASNTSQYLSYLLSAETAGIKLTPKEEKSIPLGNGAVLKIIETGNTWSSNNSNSVVCQLVYGSVKVLFTGDMDEPVELCHLNQFEDIDVLKVGHHGSSSSTSSEFLSVIKPEFAVISAGTGNSYGHPTVSVLQRLSTAGTKTLGTYKSGSVVLSANGRQYNLNKSNYLTLSDAGAKPESSAGSTSTPGINPGTTTNNTHPSSYTYIGNKNSDIFHKSSCSSVKRMKDSNKVYFSSRSQAVSSGYTPCKICNP